PIPGDERAAQDLWTDRKGPRRSRRTSARAAAGRTPGRDARARNEAPAGSAGPNRILTRTVDHGAAAERPVSMLAATGSTSRTGNGRHKWAERKRSTRPRSPRRVFSLILRRSSALTTPM